MTTADSPAGLAARLEVERRIDEAFRDAWRTDLRRRSGVCLSGFDPQPPAARTEVQLRRAARQRLARDRAWRRSPRGRLQALAGEASEAARLALRAGPDLEGAGAARAAADLTEAARRLTRTALAARRALGRLGAAGPE